MLLADRYELLQRVGRGGTGQVWEGRDTRLGRRVAVKTVHIPDATDHALVDRFCREAVATAALSHPDIVTVHDAGMDTTNPAGVTAYIVMEFLDGATLRDELAHRGRFALGEALRIGADVASALAAAHQIGVVHRDVKPANILVDGQRVTVVDFGIAALTHSDQPTLTTPGTTLGTAAYIAPEQATGAPASPAADVYSLGCVLFELLTGTPPFRGEHPLALLHQHVHEEPPRLTDVVPDVPAAVEQLLAAMLAKDPEARPVAAAVAEHLALLATEFGDDATRPLALPAPTQALPAVEPAPVAATPAAAWVDTRGDTAVHPSLAARVPNPRRRDRSARRRQRPPWPLLGTLAALLAIVVVAYAIGLRQGDAADDPIATAAATAPATAAEPASPTAAPTTAAETAGTATLAEALAGLGAAVDGLPLDGSGKHSLTEQLAAVVAAADGPVGKLDQRAREFVKRVDELERDGAITATQATALRDAVAAVVAAR